ncbi:MAG: TMEM43 family protein [Verrucomicrobiota bacterium]
MAITEVTRTGFGTRSKNSIGGAIFGVLLVAVSTILLFWNEGRSVKRYKDLKQGASIVVTVPSDQVNAANEGKLVHMTGEAETGSPLSDPQFGISVEAVKLVRDAEMFQWVEDVDYKEREQVGGSSETTKTYTYRKEWVSSLVDSNSFKDSTNHRNPGTMKYTSKSYLAKDVTVGAFDLPDFLVSMISGGDPLPAESLEGAAPDVKSTATISQGEFYFGENPTIPKIGDQRVRFTIVPTGTVSLVAQQAGNSFVSFLTKTDGKLHLLSRGAKSSEEMFTAAHEANKALTWGLRIGGFVMMMFGFSMILKPLAVFASVLPFLGRIVETGTTAIAFLLSGILWTIVVAFAWIFYRPVIGIILLLVTAGLIALIVVRLRNKSGETSSPPSAPPPLDTPPPLN